MKADSVGAVSREMNDDLNKYEFWFLTGSQDLYGDETLRQVAEDSRSCRGVHADGKMPCKIVWKPTLLTPDTSVSRWNRRTPIPSAPASSRGCTLQPRENVDRGTRVVQEAAPQFNTQFNRDIPYDTMDMDFMNLNQSAHGDREFGFITARMEIPRKVVVGHWSEAETRGRIGLWMRAACAVADGKSLRVARFGDNMREVAVTDGDKVEAMIKLGGPFPIMARRSRRVHGQGFSVRDRRAGQEIRGFVRNRLGRG
jgi:L-arabinose isomerase